MVSQRTIDKGSAAIVEFMLKLFRDQRGVRIFRSKFLVVGYAQVGKSTLIDCLFPLFSWIHTKGAIRTTRYWGQLEGNTFSKYLSPDSPSPYKILLSGHDIDNWKMESFPQEKRILIEGPRPVEFIVDDEETHRKWTERLRRIARNQATHGIEIQPLQAEHPSVAEFFSHKKINENLNLLVWDFAGQHDYYNTHQFFLTDWSVFLVLYSLKEENGYEGLQFWFQSLSFRLDTSTTSELEGSNFSIFVVGTFLGHPGVKKYQQKERENKVIQLAASCGIHCRIHYFEVDCIELDGIEPLRRALFQTVLSHSYVGEEFPQWIIPFLERIRELREKHKKFPVLSLRALADDLCAGSVSLARQGLQILSLWGECVYYENPPELSDLVILDPRFLTKEILSDLFRCEPNIVSKRQNGLVAHQDLIHIWPSVRSYDHPESLFPKFLSLLQSFGVCFPIENQLDLPFMQRRSIIPSLLPEKPESSAGEGNTKLKKFKDAWPADPPHYQPVQIERIVKFNVIPEELVARLMVSLHQHIHKELVWKHDVVVVLPPKDTLAWLRIEIPKNRFLVTLRGADLSDCRTLLSLILEKVRAMALSFPAVKFRYVIRSPYSSQDEIDLNEALDDSVRPMDQRTLTCPSTGFPLLAEKLLYSSGWFDSYSPPAKSSFLPSFPSFPLLPFPSLLFFFFRPTRSQLTVPWWATITRRNLLTLVYDNGQIADKQLFEQLSELLKAIQVKMNDVTKLCMISNPQLTKDFCSAWTLITSRHEETGALFRKDDWSTMPDWEQRKAYLLHLSILINLFREQWNNGTQVPFPSSSFPLGLSFSRGFSKNKCLFFSFLFFSFLFFSFLFFSFLFFSFLFFSFLFFRLMSFLCSKPLQSPRP